MKKFLPIVAVLIVLLIGGYFVLSDKDTKVKALKKEFVLEEFKKSKTCARIPTFLYKMGIKRPVIDLSQLHYKGIAFYYGARFNKVLHKKQWEQFDALGTYAIDKFGNIYLTPNPFISIKPDTFNLQKAIYKMDSSSGKLSRWMVIDEIEPNQNNPYGLISIVYNCKDGTLFASSIDKSNYKEVKGRIYHINPKTEEVIDKIENFDALTINLLQNRNRQFLIAGSARDNGVYVYDFKSKKFYKLFELPDPNLRVRKIKVIDSNSLKLEAIKFNYSLIAQTDKNQRVVFIVKYKNGLWHINKAEQKL